MTDTAYTTLVSAEQLAAALHAPRPPVVFDCSFDLADTQAGQHAHRAGHVPGAHYLHLDADLSGRKTGLNGRHPLPERAAFVARMAALGLHDDTPVVAYDNAGGMYAARLWWMLRWAGHRSVAVLDGGLAAWKSAGLPVDTTATPSRAPGSFKAREPLAKLVLLGELQSLVANPTRQPARLVLDARAPDRFRGENETLDPIGGRIPGARNRLFRDNLGADGRFKPAADLRQAFDAATGGRPADEVIHQCGSGVTACHNLLAMEVAGLHGAALYAGSWSEWCAQPGAPIATGAP
jgi:thiosulfate/3-mercaptopyruvate sulfurtransferase